MSDIPFAVRRRRLGYLITVLVPLGWLFVLGGIQRIQKALLLGVILYFAISIPSAVMSSIAESMDPILGAVLSLVSLGMLVVHFWIWWVYYNKWVAEWEMGSNTTSKK